MFARYIRTQIGNSTTRYQFQKRVSLFGCNHGFVPWLLRLKTPPSQGEPYPWHVNVIQELGNQPDYPNNTLLIDLKPKQNKSNLSLYEVMDVWGYSSSRWSPVLLRLNGLFIDEDPTGKNREDFTRDETDIHGPIYEFLYLAGSVADGKLVGTWNTPPVSSTNAALLWPHALNYFVQCIRTCTPEVLK